MAAPRLALSVFVLMLAAVTLSEGLRGSGPRKCCFRFNEKPVPKGRVVSYTRTSKQCSIPAVLLKTEAGRQLCVRPSAPWVKELISHLDAMGVVQPVTVATPLSEPPVNKILLVNVE